MSKVKIKLVSIGHLPINFQAAKVFRWKSSLFDLVGEFENYALRCDSDGPDWEFSDALVKKQLPAKFDADFMIAVVNVPIESNWYSRRLGDNKVVFTFQQIKDILEHYNIPLENVIYRLLYAYTLFYKRAGDKIPDYGEAPGFTHDETRGCLFDMNGIKTDLVASCDKPIICDQCIERLKQEKVSIHSISSAQAEIKFIQKDLYYRAVDFVKKHPLWSLALSSALAVVLGVMSSFVYDAIRNVSQQPHNPFIQGEASNLASPDVKR